MVQVLIIYVGGAAKKNFWHGIGTGLWGFTNDRYEYEQISAGMPVIFGHALHPGGPRSSLERFRAGKLTSLVLGRVSTPIQAASEPHWPDEVTSGSIRYRWRFAFDVEGEASNVRLEAFSRTFVETLRHSGTQFSQGEIVDLSDAEYAQLRSLPLRAYGAFPLVPGESRVTRAELDAQFGGGIQGGMLTPAGDRYIFLFSDPVPGKLYGYEFDGWADDSHSVYFYTGEGSDGPQEKTRRNAALLSSNEDGREVHLFIAVGNAAGSDARVHEYAGQFRLDSEEPYRTEDGPDSNGAMRSVYVFKLNRIDSLGDAQPPAGNALAVQVAASSGASLVDPEAANVAEFDRRAVKASTALRRERALESELIRWLRQQGKEVARLEIRIVGQSGRLLTDSWVDADRELFEVKGDSTRENVRMAVGQLLDYSRHIDPPPATRTIVLPKDPGRDLVNLAESAGLSVAVFADGELRRL